MAARDEDMHETALAGAPAGPKAGRRRVRRPWVVAFALMLCVIWGNSLVPGDDPGSLSMAVVEWLQGVLALVGLPGGWVTNFIVRKTAHFTEYLVLALIAMQAFGPHRPPRHPVPAVLTALALVAVPCIDETIQRFVGGRSSQLADVLIDCSGALAGVLLTLLASWLWHRRARRQPPTEGQLP